VTTIDEETTSEEPTLAEMLATEGLALEPGQVEQLDRYRKLLWQWNEKMNLTRHTTIEKFVTRDVVDSLQLANLLDQGERVLDVGTGGGVPGVILAIARPDLKISLCDSTQKKARAVEEMVAQLGLPVRVYACRAEDVLEVSTFDTLVARALAPMAKVLTWLKPHWESFDRLLLVKGSSWAEERGEARHLNLLKHLELRKAATYQTPRTGAESVILKIWRAADER
jgi:16S rRNA (guanine527-N7)-methyltransferase